MGSVASKGSKGHVPSVKTKFKPVSKLDAPSEIKKTDSQKLGVSDIKIEGSGASEKKGEKG